MRIRVLAMRTKMLRTLYDDSLLCERPPVSFGQSAYETKHGVVPGRRSRTAVRRPGLGAEQCLSFHVISSKSILERLTNS